MFIIWRWKYLKLDNVNVLSNNVQRNSELELKKSGKKKMHHIHDISAVLTIEVDMDKNNIIRYITK